MIELSELQKISLLVLFLGLVILSYPMFMWSIEKSLKQKSSDWFLASVVLVFCTAFFISIWTVHLAESKPELLWPAAIFTLIFRLISPIYLIKIVRKRIIKLDKNTTTRNNMTAGISVLIGTFTVATTQIGEDGNELIGVTEMLITAVVVVYSFSQFYLYLFIKQMKESSVLFAWISGLLVGIGFVVLVPQFLVGFDQTFVMISGTGWFLAAILMYLDNNKKAEKLLKMIRFT
ncbi:MAG: hypothetical protein BEU04_00630 [Marine Group III euryarchaeote CG-Bathy1]|uniref:Uncharacterized protein n=2 Tax=Methanobacteriati TaxID=3366610 RepID=A0A075G5G0_9EURY|nr:hypothetical protein [uncultured marine group II/III euryarchaeote AD1000_91_C10]OIR20344.1 MAG: hypothetical protein BEU04_00630 [Marine Group III euryarchaeote CG-Bathy1]